MKMSSLIQKLKFTAILPLTVSVRIVVISLFAAIIAALSGQKLAQYLISQSIDISQRPSITINQAGDGSPSDAPHKMSTQLNQKDIHHDSE
jgi:hypothetical protein